MKKKKQQKTTRYLPHLCDFYAPNWNENQNKTVLLEILLLFVVLLCGNSLIVQYMFFVRYLTSTFE